MALKPRTIFNDLCHLLAQQACVVTLPIQSASSVFSLPPELCSPLSSGVIHLQLPSSYPGTLSHATLHTSIALSRVVATPVGVQSHGNMNCAICVKCVVDFEKQAQYNKK